MHEERRYRRLLWLAFVVCTLAFVPARDARADGEAAVRFGCVTFAKDRTLQAFTLLAQYLTADLGRPVELVPFQGYGEIIRALLDDRLDMAMLSPLVMLKTQTARRLRPVAYGIFRSSGLFSYKSVILVRQDDPAASLSDLKGKRVAFVDPNSVSGYHIPRRALERAGVRLSDLGRYSFAGNHVDALAALVDGRADGAATFEDLTETADTTAAARRDVRRLWTSDFVIPADCFATTPRVPAALRRQLRDALLSYFGAQREGRYAQNPLYEGFVPGDPSLYDELKRFLGTGETDERPR